MQVLLLTIFELFFLFFFFETFHASSHIQISENRNGKKFRSVMKSVTAMAINIFGVDSKDGSPNELSTVLPHQIHMIHVKERLLR